MAEFADLARRRGMVSGAGFFAAFGSLWFFAGITLAESPQPIWHLVLPLVLGTALLYWRSRVAKHLSRIPSSAPTDDDIKLASRFRRRFIFVNIAQYIAIFVAAWLCVHFRRQEYIVPAVSVIVGFHFIFLSFVFRTSFHLIAGVVICLWVGAVLFIPPEDLNAALASAPAPASAVIAFGNGALLVLFTAWFLIRAQQNLPAEVGV